MKNYAVDRFFWDDRKNKVKIKEIFGIVWFTVWYKGKYTHETRVTAGIINLHLRYIFNMTHEVRQYCNQDDLEMEIS